MSGSGTVPTEHPEELLALYVDGSISSEDEASVEGHLVACARCRVEVELARAARQAVRALPDLEPPGLAAQGLAAMREGEVAAAVPVLGQAAERPIEQVRRAHGTRTWQRLAWGAGLAAAASIAAVLVLVGGGGGGGRSASPAGPAAALHPAEIAAPPALVSRGVNYTPESLARLATDIARSSRGVEAASPGRTFAGVPSPSRSSTLTAASKADALAATACLQQAAGLPSDAAPVYLESAKFKGAPAFIGAFVSTTGSARRLLLTAASAQGCQPLYSVTRTL